MAPEIEFLSDIKARVREISEQPWSVVENFALLFAVVISTLQLWFSNVGQRWVPMVDGANLLFHEAGHPFFGLFSERLEIYGGTIGQMVFPVATSIYFWKNRHSTSFLIAVMWCHQNLWNISRYMADARAQLLPLVGNGDRLHDWATIFERWNLLQRDIKIATCLNVVAWLSTAFIWRWFVRLYQFQKAQGAAH